MDDEPLLAVGPNFTSGEPRIAVRLYLDTGILKESFDAEGRKMVEANFGPAGRRYGHEENY
jgi:hypothetical protein